MAVKMAGMARGAVDRFGCPVARTAQIISNKWTPLIIRDLARGECRFSELERSLAGISPKTLSERLKYLEAERIIARDCFAEVPPRVEYSLTPKGRTLQPIMAAMAEWGERYVQAAQTVPARAAAE